MTTKLHLTARGDTHRGDEIRRSQRKMPTGLKLHEFNVLVTMGGTRGGTRPLNRSQLKHQVVQSTTTNVAMATIAIRRLIRRGLIEERFEG